MSKSRHETPRVLLIAALALLLSRAAFAQGFEDLSLIKSPTAGMIPHGSYMFEGAIGPDSSLLFGVRVGFFDRLMTGVSFGMQEFIGRGGMTVNDRPGFQARLRLLEETVPRPALAFGVDTQGDAAFDEGDDRFERKSKGLYVSLSKNYLLLRNVALHGGVNYSFENKDEGGADLFAGLSIELFKGMSALLDYTPSLNDNDTGLASCRTRGKGYLDTGIRFDYRENLRIRLLFMDLNGNYNREEGVARSIEILFVNNF